MMKKGPWAVGRGPGSKEWQVGAPDDVRAAAGSGPRPAAHDLVVEDLRKSFRTPAGDGLEVLRGVTFTLRAGESLAVVGASGAGKSTLLHVLGGLEAADGGRAALGEFDILRAAGDELARFRARGVGFVFQFHHLLPDLSAEENVALPLLVARVGWKEARASAARMLDAVGLGARAAHRPGELSGGERQRAAIARSLVSHPRLVLADEPTGDLDARTAEEAGALLFSLARARGACLLIATHNERLAQASDRRLELRDGLLHEITGSDGRA